MNKIDILGDILRQLEKDSDNNIENLKLVISAVNVNDKIDFCCLYRGTTSNLIFQQIITNATHQIYCREISGWQAHLFNNFEVIKL